jgi:hypothetical protein
MLLPFRDHKNGTANPLVWTAANLSDLHTRLTRKTHSRSAFRRLSFFKAHHDLPFPPPISNQPSSRIITRLFPLAEGKHRPPSYEPASRCKDKYFAHQSM